MDTQQLIQILKDHLRKTFYGVYAEDQLPEVDNRPLAIIVNTDPAHLDGTHWVAIYLTKGRPGEFFDSFGNPPDKPVEEYLNRHSPQGWVYNTRPVQGLFSTLCGAYCVQYLEGRHESKDPFSTLLYKLFPKMNNDILVRQRMQEHYNMDVPIYDPTIE